MTITIGPATQDVETLVQLLEAGVTCARLDLTVRHPVSPSFHHPHCVHTLDNLYESQRRTR